MVVVQGEFEERFEIEKNVSSPSASHSGQVLGDLFHSPDLSLIIYHLSLIAYPSAEALGYYRPRLRGLKPGMSLDIRNLEKRCVFQNPRGNLFVGNCASKL